MRLRLPRRLGLELAGIAVAVLSMPAARGDAAAAGLVAAYGFEEAAGPRTADSSGNGNTALLVGAIRTTDGKFGSALVFDGGTARVTVINDSPLLRLSTAMTLEAWVKPATVTSDWRDIIYKGVDNYFLEATTDHAGFPGGGGTFGSTVGVAFDTTALAVGVWSHLATTYDGAQLRLFVNGAQVASQARTGSLRASGYPLQIGGDSFFGQAFSGSIDEVRVYNRALTLAEIQADRNAPVVTPVVDTTAPTAPGPVTATAFSGTEIRLSWTAATDNVQVAGYRVERCRAVSCSNFVQVATTPVSAFDDTDLALNTLYRYEVRAVDPTGNAGPYSAIALATTASTTSVPGLVAAYPFEEGSGTTTADASATGNTGSLSGATWTAAGRFGRALAFDGTTSWVTIEDAPSLHLTNGMTLEAWVNPLSLPAPGCSGASCPWVDVIFKETDRYYLEASSDINQQPEAGGIFAAGKHILFAPAPLTIGVWTHLAVTYDSAKIRIYVNGAEVATAPETSAMTSSTSPLRVGGNSVYGQHFHGTIDEVRVYNRALSADEVVGDTNTPLADATANPLPSPTGLAPDAVAAGGAGFTLTIAGGGFVPGSLVGWNGADRATTYVSATEIHAEILASDIATGGNADVTVYNPPPFGGTSAPRSVAVCGGSTAIWYRDADGDAHGDPSLSQVSCTQPPGYVATPGDCNDADPAVWAVPGEAGSLAFLDVSTIAFAAPAAPGGIAPAYDTLRAATPAGFGGAAACVEAGGADTSTVDATPPPPAGSFFFLVRATNACGAGSAGRTSAGLERSARSCP